MSRGCIHREGFWDPMLELTITSPYLKVDFEVQQPNSQIPDWGIKSTPAQGCRTAMPDLTLPPNQGSINQATAFYPNDDECRQMFP